MKTLRFEDYSDDTFGEYGVTNEDYDNAASGKPIAFLVSASEGSMVVVGQYCPGPCGGWLIGVASHDPDCDDTPLPPWPMRIERGERPYTPSLLIECPDDVTVTHIETEE